MEPTLFMTTFGGHHSSPSSSSSSSSSSSLRARVERRKLNSSPSSLDENLSTLVDLFPFLEFEFLLLTLSKNENDLPHTIEELLTASPSSSSPSSPSYGSPLSSSPPSPPSVLHHYPSHSKHLNIGVWSSKTTHREVRASHLTSALEKLKAVVIEDLHQTLPSSTSSFSSSSRAPPLYTSSPPSRVEWVEPSSIDLHGYTVKEARDLVDSFLSISIPQLRKENKRSELEIIVGIGKHSKHGKPKLRGAILSLLKERGHTSWCEPRPGIILVGLNGPFCRT